MKNILLLTLFLLTSLAINAQSWQGPVTHNGYWCLALKPSANHNILAMKATDAGGHETLNVKFSTPYRWEGTGSACVNITQIDLSSGQRQMQEVFCHYKNGWIYIGHYLSYNKQPCYNYIITVYKANDFGKSSGESQTYNLHLDALDASRLPMNDKAIETYW